MFLLTRTIAYILPQLVHFLEVVEAAMFYYYVSEFLHKIIRGNFLYDIFKWNGNHIVLVRLAVHLLICKIRATPSIGVVGRDPHAQNPKTNYRDRTKEELGNLAQPDKRPCS